MKNNKKKKPMTNVIMGIGWYKEEQWSLLLEQSVDRNDLAFTYDEWKKNAFKLMMDLTNRGIQCEKTMIDVEEMIKWCKDNHRPLDGESRTKYISLKIEEKYRQQGASRAEWPTIFFQICNIHFLYEGQCRKAGDKRTNCCFSVG